MNDAPRKIAIPEVALTAQRATESIRADIHRRQLRMAPLLAQIRRDQEAVRRAAAKLGIGSGR